MFAVTFYFELKYCSGLDQKVFELMLNIKPMIIRYTQKGKVFRNILTIYVRYNIEKILIVVLQGLNLCDIK